MKKEMARIANLKEQKSKLCRYQFGEQNFEWLFEKLASGSQKGSPGCSVPLLTTVFVHPEKIVNRSEYQEQQ
jgi:hypothetical protein